jgi:hypothetical protein
MPTVAWNLSGFHVVTRLPRGHKSNAGSCITETLERIQKWWTEQGVGSTPRLIVHAENAMPRVPKLSMDFVRANRMTRAPHPSCSPDLTCLDFFLFGDVNPQLLDAPLMMPIVCLLPFRKFWTVSQTYVHQGLRRMGDVTGTMY